MEIFRKSFRKGHVRENFGEKIIERVPTNSYSEKNYVKFWGYIKKFSVFSLHTLVKYWVNICEALQIMRIFLKT